MLLVGQLISRTVVPCLSSVSGGVLAEVAEASKDYPRWFQLYAKDSTEYNLRIIRLLEEHNFDALVLTVDNPMLGYRDRDYRVNMRVIYKDGKRQVGTSFITPLKMDVVWEFITWIRSVSKIKLILKGIHRVDDALKAHEIGVDAIVVSNHGGRQHDTTLSGIEML